MEIIVHDKMSGSTLGHFQLVNVDLCVWTPDCTGIDGPKHSLVTILLNCLFAKTKVSLQKSDGGICFCYYPINMISPF